MQTTFGIGTVDTTGTAAGVLVDGAATGVEGITVLEEITGACVDDVAGARVVVVDGCAI